MTTPDPYRSNPAQGSHDLMRALRGYRHWKTGGITQPTESMIIGSAAHCLLLEPDHFETRYCEAQSRPDDLITSAPDARKHLMAAGHTVKSTAPAGEIWTMLADLCPDAPTASRWHDEQAARAEGRDVLTPYAYQRALGIAAAVRADEQARAILDSAHALEHPAYFERSGVPCKAKYDIFAREWFADLKTCADPFDFAKGLRWSAERTLFQLRHYYQTGMACPYVIAVGSEAPHDVIVMRVALDVLHGDRVIDLYQAALDNVRRWQDAEADAAITGKDIRIPAGLGRIIDVTTGGPQW
jgi:hypothetical protein